jgi:hypothetical protein
LVGLITCFTIAHSLTLLCSILGQVNLPPLIVEPLIAASIVFVGVENWITRGEPRARMALSFSFGLVHGLGFASGLQELGVGSAALLPLFAFNFGVELGQAVAALLFLPLILFIRRHPQGPWAARAVSIVMAAAGSYWFVERTLLA